MPIDFFDFRDHDGWESIHFTAGDINHYWHDRGVAKPLSAAPFDFEGTLGGALSHSTKVEAAFQWRGRKLEPGRTLPTRHHNLKQLMLVLDGDLAVEYGESGEESVKLERAGFWVAEAGVPYTMTAGPAGAAYLECWDAPLSVVEDHWHDDGSWKRR
ncbi:hypothetical protein [Nocardioides sp. cx-173]|uniref:hypothetical protein n=1 Tax=Nocardioides sp. cx-173 TaxID=2898796 RepID=UPI001E51B97C|nr:hypothetical protein [Nocardioides sp. cx-173]MCD4524290.1 hypothetical protein [Nocardioides sp. cx-173]UGB41682.1 hypothetical protein LQ940_20285 [Nocardioides sp. cx-173]